MSQPSHLPDRAFFDALEISEKSPLTILFSGCLMGNECSYDGGELGGFSYMHEIRTSPLVNPIAFCPEEFSFGTPRLLSDIHGGDGFDVLDGKAKVIAENGDDWTEKMIVAANWMTGIALDNNVQLAILLDISAACGSQTIYKGDRTSEQPEYQIGMGVCAANLWRHGVRIMSQRDYRTMALLLEILGIEAKHETDGLDHHQREWYRAYFNV